MLIEFVLILKYYRMELTHLLIKKVNDFRHHIKSFRFNIKISVYSETYDFLAMNERLQEIYSTAGVGRSKIKCIRHLIEKSIGQKLRFAMILRYRIFTSLPLL